MTKPARRAIASLLLVSALILSACAAGPAASSSPSSTPAPSLSASPAPTPGPIAQAFGGDCDQMLADEEVVDLIGEPNEIDVVAAALDRLGLGASADWAGGITCEWESDLLGMRVLVLPRSVVSEERDPDTASVNEYPCLSSGLQCSWTTARGPWWVTVWVYPLAAYETWTEDPTSATEAADLTISRSAAWAPPSDRDPKGDSVAACDRLLTDVDSLAPEAGVKQSGGEIDPVDFVVIDSRLAVGCYWEIPSGMVLIRIQPSLGEFPASDLLAAQAEATALPGGRAAHRITLSDYWATIMTEAGGTRFSVSGTAPASDPEAAAAVLEATVNVVLRGRP